MKFAGIGYIAALATALLGLGAFSGAQGGQTAGKAASPSTTVKSNSAGQKCGNVGADAEQIKETLRNMQLEQKIAALSQRLAKEEVMSSPELARLQNLSAQLDGKKGEIEAQAATLSERAREIASQWGNELQQNGNVFISPENDAGWLGVEIGEVSAEKAKELKLPEVRGVIVEEVEADSPAAKAGLKENDVILQYDGQAVEGTMQFRRLVRETPPGRSVSLEVMRNGATQTLSVQVANRNAYYEKRMRGAMRDFGKSFSFNMPEFGMHGPETFLWANPGAPTLGIQAEDLSGQLGAYFGAPDDAGVLVSSVGAGTPAQKAGLKAGDVIVSVAGVRVKTVAELREQLGEKRDQQSVRLGIIRRGSQMSLSVQLEHAKPRGPYSAT